MAKDASPALIGVFLLEEGAFLCCEIIMTVVYGYNLKMFSPIVIYHLP